MPQLNPYWIESQILWLSLSFIFLYLVMARASLPRLGSLLEERRSRIKADLELAEAARKQSEVIDQQNQAQLKAARGRAAEIISEMQKESEALAAQRHADLDKLLQRKIAEAQTKIEKAREEAIERVVPISVELTQAVLKKISGLEIPRDVAEKVVASQMRSKHV